MRVVAILLGLAMFAMGAGMLVVGAGFAQGDAALAAKGGTAQGTVVAVESYRSNRGKVAYYPIVAFVDQTGRQRQFASKVSSNPPSYARGDEVRVLYDPANPGDAMIDSFVDRYLGALVFGIMGAIFTVIGGWVLVRLWQRRLRGE